ncbi:DNA primase, partial [Desulfobacterales bacterium HSG17]|nr:DNA primase [Desulfobacterales bacterium HSG17]
PEIIDDISNTGVLEYFYSKKLKLVGKKIISMSPDTKAFITNVMAKMENNEDQKLIASLSMDDSFAEQEDIQKTALSLINRIIRIRKRKENTLTSKIISAEKGCDSELMELLKEKQAEIQQLQNRL